MNTNLKKEKLNTKADVEMNELSVNELNTPTKINRNSKQAVCIPFAR